MEKFNSYEIIKIDDLNNAQTIELTDEQWSGCIKIIYAMNRAGFDLSKILIFCKI